MNPKILFSIVAAIVFVVAGISVVSDEHDAFSAGQTNVYIYDGSDWSDYPGMPGYNAFQALQSTGLAVVGDSDFLLDESQGVYKVNADYGSVTSIAGVSETGLNVWNVYVYTDGWSVAAVPPGFITSFSDNANGSANVVFYYGADTETVPSTVASHVTSYADLIDPVGNDAYVVEFILSVNTNDELSIVEGTTVEYYDADEEEWFDKTLEASDLAEGITIRGYGSNVFFALVDAVGASNVDLNDGFSLFGLSRSGGVGWYQSDLLLSTSITNLGVYSPVSNAPTDDVLSSFEGSSFMLSYQEYIPNDDEDIWIVQDDPSAGFLYTPAGFDAPVVAPDPEPVSYSVTYVCYGPATAQTIFASAGPYEIIDPYVDVDHHTFAGWLCSDGETYQPGDVIQLSSDISFSGIWNPETFTVSFDVAGGSSVIDTQTVGYGLHPDDVNDPVRNGFVFDTWKVTSGSSFVGYADDVSDVTVTRDLVFTAVWKEIFTVSFDVDGGSPSISDRDVVDGDPIGIVPSVTKDGCRFDGWYVGDRLISNPAIEVVHGDMTLVAHWVQVYTVTLITLVDGGTGSYTESFDGGSVDALVHQDLTSFVPSDYPDSHNVEFVGWFYGSGSGSSFEWGSEFATPCSIDSDVTIYAKWVCPDTGYSVVPGSTYYDCTIHYGVNDHVSQAYGLESDLIGSQFLQEPEDPVQFIEDEYPGLISDQGLQFIGWYFVDDDGQPDFSDDPVSFPLVAYGDFSLYAKWIHVEPGDGDDTVSGNNESADSEPLIDPSLIAVGFVAAILCLLYIFSNKSRRH